MLRVFAILSVLILGASCSSTNRFLDGGYGSPKEIGKLKLQDAQYQMNLESGLQREPKYIEVDFLDSNAVLSLQLQSNLNRSTESVTCIVQSENFRNQKIHPKGKIKTQEFHKGIDRHIRNIGKTVAKIGFYSSIIGLISSKLFLFSAAGILLGLLALIYKAKFKTKIFAYLAILLGILGIISPVLTTVLLILVVILLILLTLKWMHWI